MLILQTLQKIMALLTIMIVLGTIHTPNTQAQTTTNLAVGDKMTNAPGTVKILTTNYYGFYPDDDPNRPYMLGTSDELPAEFRQDGMRVLVSGELLPPPPGVRLMATPFKLTNIEQLNKQTKPTKGDNELIEIDNSLNEQPIDRGDNNNKQTEPKKDEKTTKKAIWWKPWTWF